MFQARESVIEKMNFSYSDYASRQSPNQPTVHFARHIRFHPAARTGFERTAKIDTGAQQKLSLCY